MRRFVISSAIAASVALSGCASFPGISLPGVTIGPTVPVSGTTPGTAIVNNAISLAGTFCSIGPTAASIINIFVSNPLLVTAEDAARAFCAAIAPKPSLTGAARPLLSGMVLKTIYRGKPIVGTVL